MTKKIIALFVALLSATLLFAKPYTQQGIAFLYDYKTKTKNPVANVSLTVAYAKGPAISRTDGTFSIEFQDFGAGKKLAFEKQPFSHGLIVLNKKEVDGWSTFEGRLKLVMCNKKDFDVCKQKYYDVGLQSVTQRYEQKIAALKQESADYQQRLQELEEERDRIMDNLRNSADAMARIDQSELDDVMQEVLDLYEKGNVDEAMQKLEDMKLAEKFIQTLDKKHEGERIVAEATEDSVMVLNKLRTSVDMYQNSGNWDKAAAILKLLADKLDTHKDHWHYADFCGKQKIFDEAEIYYKRALVSLMIQKDKECDDYIFIKSCLQNNLACIYKETRRFTEAETLFNVALEANRQQAVSYPLLYEPGMAIIMNSLAELYSCTNRITKAETMYDMVLEIYRRWAKDVPTIYEPLLSAVLTSRANLYNSIQHFTEAESLYNEALEIYKRQTQEQPTSLKRGLAKTLNDLAFLYKNTNRLVEAETMYNEALIISRQLARYNPSAYELDVAAILNNFASLLSETQRFTECESVYFESLEIFKRQAKANPSAFENNVAAALYNIGMLRLKQEKYADAISPFEEALVIFRNLIKNDVTLQYYYEGSLYWLSYLYHTQYNHIEAYRINREWLPILRGQYEANPNKLRKEYASKLDQQSFFAICMKEYTEAEQLAREGLQVDSTKHWIACNLAAALLLQGRYDEAESIYSQYKDELKEGILDDFEQFKAVGVIPKEREEDVERIKKILTEE